MHRPRLARPDLNFSFDFARRLPRLRVPHLRMPRLGRPRLPRFSRPSLEPQDLERLGPQLQFFFYLLMFVALLAIFTGATGVGILMLVAGAALHVSRSSIAEVVAAREARRERAERKREVRLRPHRAARKVRQQQPAAAAPASAPAPARPPRRAPAPRRAPVAAPEPIRVTASPQAAAWREARATALRQARTPARKQRVI